MPTGVTVYCKPRCVQCDATKKKLDQLGIQHETIDVSEDADALSYIKSLGYLQAPVVVAGDDHWTGYRPHRLEELKQSLSEYQDED
ncbi:glutaredoxin-like protein NrdH [Nocardia sp. NPDC049707]|uniref:glutaredoxin-like protein NrdH n=1 Tax=Nocardia sp. NPDC049707 TaxID=3154735 RepID=UPI0034228B46